MECNKGRRQSLLDKEKESMKEFKSKIQEYLGSGDGSKVVRDYISKAYEDEVLLLRFLKGRKYRPKHSWETLKKFAEVKYELYPEFFPLEFPKAALPLIDNHIIGILKARDSKGRRIAYFNGSEWDTSKYSLEFLTMAVVHLADRVWQDEDCTNNGLVFIQECSGMNMKHVKEYTLQNMLRFMNIFWYAFPIKLKGVYYVNVPYIFTFIYGLIKPFFPKKLKERFLLSPSSKNFDALHERVPREILPKLLGGPLETEEALDLEFLRF